MFDFYPGPLSDMEEEHRPLGLSNAVDWDMLYPLGPELTSLKRSYLRMLGLAGFYSIGLFGLLVFSTGQLLTPREAVISMLINHCTTRLIKMIYSERTVRPASRNPSEFTVTYDSGEICTVQKSSPSCSYRSPEMSGEGEDVLDLGPGSPFAESLEAGPKSVRSPSEDEEQESVAPVSEEPEDELKGPVNETAPKEIVETEDESEAEGDAKSEDSWVEGHEIEPVGDPEVEPVLRPATFSPDLGAATVAGSSQVVDGVQFFCSWGRGRRFNRAYGGRGRPPGCGH